MTEQRAVDAPKTFQAAVAAAEDKRMTPEEAAQAEREVDDEVLAGDVPDDSPLGRKAASEPRDANALPPWVKVPSNLNIPPEKQIGFMGFLPAWTDRPSLGFRHCIFWSLSVADEKLAKQAARGGDALPHLAMRMIRAIDGHKADWTGKKGNGNVEQFWESIGGRCRPLIINAYWKLHSLEAEETADFFLNYSTFRSAVAG